MQGLHEFQRGVSEFNRGVNELNRGVNKLNRGVNRSVARQGCNLLRAAVTSTVTSQGCCCGNLQIHPLDLGHSPPPGHGEQSEVLIRGTRCRTCLVKVQPPGRVRVTTLTTPSGPGETSVCWAVVWSTFVWTAKTGHRQCATSSTTVLFQL